MGFVYYRVLWILKALWIVLSENINILRNVQQQNNNVCPPPPPREFYIGLRT